MRNGGKGQSERDGDGGQIWKEGLDLRDPEGGVGTGAGHRIQGKKRFKGDDR